MAIKAMNFKMEEEEILDIKKVASVFIITMTDIIKEGVREYVEKLKQDPFYKLTTNIQEASETESAEILGEIELLDDDELKISSRKTFTL